MEAGKPYWNMEVETKLNTPEMKEIQWEKVKKRIDHFWNTTTFWNSYWGKAGVTPEKIKTWDDFQKRIPILSKDDFRLYALECGGDMLKIIEGIMGKEEADSLICLATTSGTSGDPTPYPLTSKDMKAFSEWPKRAFWRAGIYPGDKVLHAMGLSMFIGGVPMCMAASDYGVCVIPVGAEAGTEQILNYAAMLKPKCMVCTPSLAEYMIEKAKETIGVDVDFLNIQTIICGGEPGAGIPEVRQRIEGAFHATLYDMGAGLGCSCGHPDYQGMHWLMDDMCFFELVDQETHDPIPWEDGATGMGVFTSLEGSLLLGVRQTLGDIFQVETSPCPCGQTGFRYKVIGRNDDMLKVKGVMVYPAAIEGVVNKFLPEVTGEFRIVLDEPPPRVQPPLKLKVEYGEGVSEDQREDLAGKIEEEMHRRIKIRPKIAWVPPKTLERFVKKKNLLEKTYDK